MAVGLLNSSQFIALGAATGKEHQAKATSLYFLSQQLGLLIGASGSTALLNKTFRDALDDKLGGRTDSEQVCISHNDQLYVCGELAAMKATRELVMKKKKKPKNNNQKNEA